jgi:hypothetical protein
MSRTGTLAAIALALTFGQTSAQADDDFWQIPPRQLYAADAEFCAHFAAAVRERREWDDTPFRIALPVGATIVEPQRSLGYEYGGSSAYYAFDIDNDGVTNHVVGVHERTHAIDGDAYYVYESEPPAAPPIRTADFQRETRLHHAQAAKRTLPIGWEKYPSGGDANYSANVPQNLAPYFPLRYFYLQPFVFDGLTYFRTATTVLDYRHLQLIARPERDGSLTTLCLFSFEPIPSRP